MTTIHAKVSRTDCYLKVDGSLTSGMVGVPISFEFTPEWKELKKTAVFYAGTVKRDRINIERSTTVPAEVLQKSMENLYVGIYGYREDGTIVIPTVMAKVGMILRGANPSGDPGVDPNLPIWADLERRVSDLEEGCGDAAVKSVNGIAPDENGNVEIKLPEGSGSSVTIDPTLTKSGQAADAKAVGDALAELEKKIPEQSGSPELFDKADLPIDPQSFVTVDGVEYYRYHAGPTNFTWNNPHPQTGSVTITARGVSQYGGTGTARLKTVYNDGTFGPDIYIVVGGESRTASVTTDENKTLAKITGNYDLENWVLLDMSVMSVRADYLVQEECILPVATADTLGGVKPVAKGTDMTQKVGVDELGGLWTAPGGGGEWTKIGEVTLTGKTLPITAVADNMVKVDTTSGITVNKNTVVHKKDYSDFNAVRFNSTDVAGQYVLKNLDNGVINVDESWVGREIEIPDADYLRIAIGGKFNYLKVVVTAPAIMFHGARAGFTFGYVFECPHTVFHFSGCSVIYEAETMPCPVDGYMYVQGMWRGGKVGVKQTYSEMRMVKKAVVPAEFSMGHFNGILTIGTRVELWGKA